MQLTSQLDCGVLRDSGVGAALKSRRVRFGVDVLKVRHELLKGDFLLTAAECCVEHGDARRCCWTVLDCIALGEAVMVVTKEIGESVIDHLIGGGTNFVRKGRETRQISCSLACIPMLLCDINVW